MILENINQKHQLEDIPVDGKMKQKIKQKIPFHHSPEYTSLRNHFELDEGDLPSVLEGMSIVGDVNGMETKMVTAIKHDGTKEEIVDPFDAIMSGKASTTETHDFLEHYIMARITPPITGVHRGEKPKAKHLFTVIWNKHLPDLKKLFDDERNVLDSVKEISEFDVIKDNIYSETVAKVKQLSTEMANEMKTANEKLKVGDLDYLYDTYISNNR